jgi:hypothetical protein
MLYHHQAAFLQKHVELLLKIKMQDVTLIVQYLVFLLWDPIVKQDIVQ